MVVYRKQNILAICPCGWLERQTLPHFRHPLRIRPRSHGVVAPMVMNLKGCARRHADMAGGAPFRKDCEHGTGAPTAHGPDSRGPSLQVATNDQAD